MTDLNAINAFRFECANCGKHEDLPMNPSLERVNKDAMRFWKEHRTGEKLCQYSQIFIRSYVYKSS